MALVVPFAVGCAFHSLAVQRCLTLRAASVVAEFSIDVPADAISGAVSALLEVTNSSLAASSLVGVTVVSVSSLPTVVEPGPVTELSPPTPPLHVHVPS